MQYVPKGKKAKQRLAERKRDQRIDAMVSGVRFAIRGPRLCLQMSVLLESLLADVLPGALFKVRLGSLHVYPTGASSEGTTFDPRGPSGVDGGSHAWVEDRRGELVDPSIAITLATEGYDINPTALLQSATREFAAFGLGFLYEPLDELELVNLDASAHWLATMRELAETGTLSPSSPRILVCPLNVRLRSTTTSNGERSPM